MIGLRLIGLLGWTDGEIRRDCFYAFLNVIFCKVGQSVYYICIGKSIIKYAGILKSHG